LFFNFLAEAKRSSSINNEFYPDIVEFRNIINHHKYDDKLDNLTILFDDIESTNKGYVTLAYCQMMFTDSPYIVVDRKEYYSATPMSRYFTVLHELGHCICNRFHTETSKGLTGFLEEFLFKLGIAEKKGYLPDGCPSSLMHPYSFSESCMLDHYFYYVEEFKQGCQ
jgi:hypothetical protein